MNVVSVKQKDLKDAREVVLSWRHPRFVDYVIAVNKTTWEPSNFTSTTLLQHHQHHQSDGEESDMANEAPTFRSFVTAFTDFLTVAIHTLLYERAIYPQTSFLSARKYNFAVRQNRHPKVCEWINDAVGAVETELLKGSVERVAVVMYSKQNKPLERFVFDLGRFPVVPAAEVDLPMERLDSSGSKAPILPSVDLEEQFRATMSRMTNCSAALRPLPKGCTFTVAIELRRTGEAPLGHPQPWVPAEQEGAEVSARKQTTGVRSVTAGEMEFEMWIENLQEETPQSFTSEASG